jgi:1,4-dihydroxy-2-naphthoyl-CoA hydrolase
VGVPEDIPSGFADYIGTEWLVLDPEEARARIELKQHHLQPNGFVHGGVYASLAESICSAATYRAVRDQGMLAFGQANSTTFLRPISAGHVNATARTRQRGRTIWVWDVDLRDDEDRLCALVRMTIAVRPQHG